jgi:SAM-dependent methyltransferase
VDSDAAYFRRRARSFGSAARIYDQARPGYPAALFAHIAGQLPGPRVLEVGAGTGKATAGLLDLGLEVTCVEPDPAMAAVLAERTAAKQAERTAAEPGVRIEVETFETFETFESCTAEGTYDGLVSAQAWQYTDPATRMDRAAALLRPGGFLGLFWSGGCFRRPEAVAAIEAIYDEFGLHGEDRPGEPVRTAARLAEIQDPDTWPGDEIAAHPAFEYRGTSTFPWSRDYTAAEFGAFLSSTSWYRLMEPEARDRLLTAITGTLRDQFGDLVGVDYSTQCYDAHRLGR